MQSRYSTFKEEGQYLAGGLKIIHEDLKADVAMIQSMIHYVLKENGKVESLSIVEVEFERWFPGKIFYYPCGRGRKNKRVQDTQPQGASRESTNRQGNRGSFRF